ncbi:MAG: Gamma-glutamyl phosphate reductase [Candidatus Omnitrophica bacterium ADurb.Bin314]|nr:MAG: Gamma-glutamyl phosphate reductase [Candidatus Omnitrophica bacterium ADurb.Bin314]HOE68701.1 glutamate-5-semialdehyde dehydrogenase [Candidatus Omnitrophota bacterium]
MKSSGFRELDVMVGKARDASREAAQWSGDFKKKLLLDVSRRILSQKKYLLRENEKEVHRARAAGLAPAMVDRLALNEKRLIAMAEGVRMVAGLKDPVGHILAAWTRPNGLRLKKVAVPLGVIFIIYESRPNVTVECASLCLKSSNAVILRGGREAMSSNRAFVKIFHASLRKFGAPVSAVNLVRTVDYAAVDHLLAQEGKIDLVIPRGGEKLIRRVVERSRIPVVKHYQGICHVYIDRKADLAKAVPITLNAKLQRPGVCNAMETLLLHRVIAEKFLRKAGPLLREGNCEIRGDAATCRILPYAVRAKASDYGHEFLDRVLAVKVVENLGEALDHIERYGSRHTDAIVTEDRRVADVFKARVDSSSVMVNASTRFSDGFEYGFGAEIGISTDKVHARGPMGLEGLTSYKYIVEGKGQIRT